MSEAIERSTLGKRLAAHAVAPEVVRKSREGETPPAIAAWLQEDLLLFTEAGRDELEIAVKEHFLTEVPLEERLEIQRAGRSAIAATVARQRQHRSARERLELLSDLQMGRLEIMHELEAEDGKLVGSGANDIEIARRIAMNIHEVSKDTGDRGHAPPTTDLGVKIGRILLSIMQDKPEEIEVTSEPKEQIEDAEFTEA